METTGIELEEALKTFPIASGLDFTCKRWAKKNDENRNYTTKSSWFNTGLLHGHVKGDLVAALSPFPKSSVIYIDIDQRSQSSDVESSQVLDIVISELGNPFYVEHSPSTGGYHLCYDFRYKIGTPVWKAVEKYFFEEYNVKVEFVTGQQVIRLPYSNSYRENCGLYSSTEKTRIKDQCESFKEVVHLFRNRDISSLSPLLRMLNVRGEAPKIVYENDEVTLEKTIAKGMVPYSYSYGRGTRHIFQPLIAFQVLRCDGDFDDFVSSCKQLNVTNSKDMRQPEYYVTKMLESIWEWANKHFKSSLSGKIPKTSHDEREKDLKHKKGPLGSFSEQNLNPISDSEKKEFIKALQKAYPRVYKFRYGKTSLRQDRILSALRLLEAMRNKKAYDKFRGKQYSSERLSHFDKVDAVLFDEKTLARCANAYALKNPKRLLSLLVSAELIEPAADKDGWLYSYAGERFGRHWLFSKSLGFRKKSTNTLFIHISSNTVTYYSLTKPAERPQASQHKVYTKELKTEFALWWNFVDRRGRSLKKRHQHLLNIRYGLEEKPPDG